MDKIKMGPVHLLNPKPVVLVGTAIDNKPNFITVSWIGLISADPPALSIAIRNVRYSLQGLLTNKTFSVNIPSVKMVKDTDYCGSVSGSTYNKVVKCGFELFYGSSENAPLIKQCPINIECEVIKFIEIGDHSVFIGKIIETYISSDCITDGIPDINKIDPLCFCTLTSNSMGYYKLGEFITGTASVKSASDVEK